MSTYTAKTGLTSILKSYTPTQRDKTKDAFINRERFEEQKKVRVIDVVNAYCDIYNELPLNYLIRNLREVQLDDSEFKTIIIDANSVINQLTDDAFNGLVESILQLKFVHRSKEAKRIFADFCVDIISSQTKHMQTCINSLVSEWIPAANEPERWPKGIPDAEKRSELEETHKLLSRILTIIPVSFNVLLQAIEKLYPYIKKPCHVLAGYLHNLLWLLEYNPMFNECILNLVFEHLVLLDVNAPRSEIEETDFDDENDDEDENIDDAGNMKEVPIFEMEDCEAMKHPIANSLDMCLEQIYAFLDTRNPYATNITTAQKQIAVQFSNALFKSFDHEILAKYNSHHVQFIMFYYCSFKLSLAESFLNSLWEKVKDLNVPSVIRQASVSYIASFLARSKYLPLTTLQNYLKEFCDWVHTYIQNCDQYRSNTSLKANILFYTICQCIFYIIAFRSRDLTSSKKGLLFLQSLRLPGLVTCHLNPLRVCLHTVATAFAGVTRTYQIAYCHAILERNARRRLTIVYGQNYETPEETLDTFFPFDPYLLKSSNKRIQPLYLQYQASDTEELAKHQTSDNENKLCARKRGDSEMLDEAEIDDFLVGEKRQRFNERETQFTYGLSPGFHI